LLLRRVQLKRPVSAGSVRLGWSLALLACAAQTAAHLTNELVLGGRFPDLDASADGNAFAWLTTAAIASLAVFTVAAAVGGIMRWFRAAILAVGLVLLALDDATGFHDRLHRLRAAWLPGPPGVAAAAAAGIFALLLALVFLLLWIEAAQAQASARRMIQVGLLALAAALATRVVGAAFAVEGTFSSALRAFGVAGEQGLDLAGWILVTVGFAARRRGSAAGQSSSPLPHWPAFTATLTEKPRPASITAPTFPEGEAKTRRSSL
jgi:hypothetical protein